jgi:nickel/cobalt exporter
MGRAVNLRRLLCATGVVGVVVLTPTLAVAHPLGNFTVNRYTGLRVGTDQVVIDYVVDQAEIPTVQVRSEIDRDGDGDISGVEQDRYESGECGRLARGLELEMNDERLALRVRGGDLTFPPGQAGLLTTRLECRFEAPTDEASGEPSVSFRDANYADRVGWREITAVGDGTTIVDSDVPERSISSRLTAYPDDRLRTPLDRRSAQVRFRPGGAAASPIDTSAGGGDTPSPGGLEGLTESFAELESAVKRPRRRARPGA